MIEHELEQSLMRIGEFIKDGLGDKACAEYIKLLNIVENQQYKIDMELKANFYASFAYFLFNVSEYNQCLNMLVRAQMYGYSKTEIEQVIWEAFVKPNLNEFKNIYEKNIKFLISKGYILRAIDFSDLTFWLIPTMIENEYYIYDKIEKVIKEKINISVNNKLRSVPILDKFSDFLILEDWNWNKIEPYLDFARRNNKRSYVIINDFAKFLSFFQGGLIDNKFVSDILIFDGFDSMKKYFKESNKYLPRNILNLTDKIDQGQKVIDQIHNYRITMEGRKGNNVLLSIGIPSYNRGNRAYNNIIHNLQCYYDEEIEFVLSNNGTQNETKEYYEKIPKINDSRINYFAFEKNHGVAINICKVCEMAQGKFILLLSDEDLINLNNLDRVINILNGMKETLSIVRTKGDGQAVIPSTKLAKAGKDAMLTYMLSSNYLSGIIFNNELIKKYNLTQYIRNNLDNTACFYYPHMCLELFLCQYGDAKGIDIVLINEGKSEKTEVVKRKIGTNKKVTINHYASIEGRLKQHKGFFNIFKELEICKNDFITFNKMYIKLFAKTIFLINISIQLFYKKIDEKPLNMLNKTYEFCVEYLNKIYENNKCNDKKDYINFLNQITAYYEYYKKQYEC